MNSDSNQKTVDPIGHVKTHADGITVPFDDILYCTTASQGNIIHLKDKHAMHTLYSLKKLQAQLPQHFERVHHSYIVNVHAIRDIHDNGDLYLTLHNGERLPISTRRKTALFKHFTKL